MKRLPVCCLLVFLLAAAPSADAGTKEELVRLQADVLALQNQIRLLEKTFSERTQGLHSLVVQLNDQVGRTSLLLDKLALSMENRDAGERSANTAVLEEIRSLSRKFDDTGVQISALTQQLADMRVQSKPITQRIFQAAGANPQTLALSADAIYNEAFNDLIQGNFDLAIEGFRAFLRSFPSNENADDAQYNIGEAFYAARKLPDAIAAFAKVISDYPSGDKVASAHFKRAKAHLLMGDRTNAISDFRRVVEKYPAAPEAGLAESELKELGVDISKPSTGSTPRRRP